VDSTVSRPRAKQPIPAASTAAAAGPLGSGPNLGSTSVSGDWTGGLVLVLSGATMYTLPF